MDRMVDGNHVICFDYNVLEMMAYALNKFLMLAKVDVWILSIFFQD